ncbi:hypothetical protein KAW64_13050, partial [bacterium]|nr:hypothetical protein [bacterium]
MSFMRHTGSRYRRASERDSGALPLVRHLAALLLLSVPVMFAGCSLLGSGSGVASDPDVLPADPVAGIETAPSGGGGGGGAEAGYTEA